MFSFFTHPIPFSNSRLTKIEKKEMVILDNPLFNVNNNKNNSSNIEYSAVANDQAELIDGESEPRKQFERLFARWWPFGVLKTLNFFFLLAIAALAIVNAAIPREFSLDWSDCWDILPRVIGILRPYRSGPLCARRLVCACIVLLAMAAFSWMTHKFAIRKRPSSLPGLALRDLCIGLMTVANLAVIAIVFAVRAFAEFTWFWPKLHDESLTLAELIEWDKIKDGYPYNARRYYGSRYEERTTTQGTPTDKDIEKMEFMKQLIQARLVFDPAMVALTMLAILLQAVFLWRTVSALKRSKLWVGNYATAHAGCTPLAVGYARFWPIGLFKFAHAFIPLAMFNFTMYESFENLTTRIVIGLFSIPFVLNWLSYVQKVHFRGQQQQGSTSTTIEQLCKKDGKFMIFALLAYGFLYMFITAYSYRGDIVLIVIMVAMALLAISLVLNLRLLQRHGDGEAGRGGGRGSKLFNLPTISVNISVNVVKKGAEEEEARKMKNNANANNGLKEEDDDEVKKEHHMENP